MLVQLPEVLALDAQHAPKFEGRFVISETNFGGIDLLFCGYPQSGKGRRSRTLRAQNDSTAVEVVALVKQIDRTSAQYPQMSAES